MKIAYAPCYHLPLPPGHRFPMAKYDLLPEQLLREGTVEAADFFEPAMLPVERILRTHTLEYWTHLDEQTLPAKAARKIGFPLTPEMVVRERIIAQGTVDCSLHALREGVSLNIAGGTHHAYAGSGEGFCVFNDIAIGANHLLDEGLAKQVLVVDLDVHQGNGTAKIFEHEPRVFTFSMHGEKNYPSPKEKSDLDMGLPDGADDEFFLSALYRILPQLMDAVQPDFVYFLSGVDVLATDKLGRLGMTLAGCKERDRYVLQTCKNLQIPVAVSMGGGYSERLAIIIEAHANTFRLAQKIFF